MTPTKVSEIPSWDGGPSHTYSSASLGRIGIGIQFAALIRCLGEFFRLKYFVVEKFSFIHIEPFIIGALVTAILALVGFSSISLRSSGSPRSPRQ